MDILIDIDVYFVLYMIDMYVIYDIYDDSYFDLYAYVYLMLWMNICMYFYLYVMDANQNYECMQHYMELNRHKKNLKMNM